MENMKKIVVLICLLYNIITFSYVLAETNTDCASGQAAQQGSDKAYEKEKEQIEKQADREFNISDMLEQCISAVVNVPVVTFPSIDDILKEIQNKICSEIREKIDQVNKNIPNNKRSLSIYDDTNLKIAALEKQAQKITAPMTPQKQIPRSITNIPNTPIQQDVNQSSDELDLSEVWK